VKKMIRANGAWTNGGYNIHKRRSKSRQDIPRNRIGKLSDDPSTTWPTGSGKEKTSLNTLECRVNVERKTLNNEFSTCVIVSPLVTTGDEQHQMVSSPE
jgi:hypothetical protein